jgi:DNA repair photolyase
MYKIGITERGDAGLHLEWVNKISLVEFAILITKNPNDSFIKQVLQYKNKVIVHSTCTGFAGTLLEPNVPSVDYIHNQLEKLIEQKFPANQIVLRIDPVIPTEKGIEVVNDVLVQFQDLGIKRIRFSFLDFYPHVKERFRKSGLPIPYNTLPTKQMYQNFQNLINKWDSVYSFESCAEDIGIRQGCISNKDAIILGKDAKMIKGSANQRAKCLCPSNKFEMLSHKGQCYHRCLYCYWY